MDTVKTLFVGQWGPYASAALPVLMQKAPSVQTVLVVVGKPRSWKGPALRVLKPSASTSYSGDDLCSTALSLGCTVAEVADINSAACVRLLKSYGAQYGVCVGFDRLFSKDVLGCVSDGFFNAHPSELPLLRGPSPFFWMLKQGHTRGCVSVHRMVVSEDAGDVYTRQYFSWPEGSTGSALLKHAGRAAGYAVASVLQGFAEGRAMQPTAQDTSIATRAPRPLVSDAQIQPWLWGCAQLYAFACAAPFFVSPWMSLGGTRWKVVSGVSYEKNARIPGQYVWWGEHMLVQCMDGTVTLKVDAL